MMPGHRRLRDLPTDPRGPERPRSCRSSWSPRAAPPRRSGPSRPAPTTSSPSPSTRPSCWPGCARWSGSSATTTPCRPRPRRSREWNERARGPGRRRRSPSSSGSAGCAASSRRRSRARRRQWRRVVPAEPPAGDHAGLHRPAGVHALRGARRAGGDDGRCWRSTTHALGELVFEYEGTLEHFAGDGLLVFFNDPVPCPDAPDRAVRMAVDMRDAGRRARRRVAPARLRPGLRGRASPRGTRRSGGSASPALRLRRHRDRDEPRGPAVLRGRGTARSSSPSGCSTGCWARCDSREVGPAGRSRGSAGRSDVHEVLGVDESRRSAP